ESPGSCVQEHGCKTARMNNYTVSGTESRGMPVHGSVRMLEVARMSELAIFHMAVRIENVFAAVGQAGGHENRLTGAIRTNERQRRHPVLRGAIVHAPHL